jgi:hypothetical protein
MDITTEHQRSKEVEQQLNALVAKARGLIVEQFGPLVTAIQNAEKLVAEAHTLARQFNLDEGHGWCFNEDFALSIDNKPAVLWQEFLTTESVHVSGETAPQPAVRLHIPPDVHMRDYPPQSAVALPRSKAERLLAEKRGYRV